VRHAFRREPDTAEELFRVSARARADALDVLHERSTSRPCCEFRYVFVYSGPEPPSGGVKRPPLAVIAPHCTQFDGATFTVTVPSPPSVPSSYTCAGHMLIQSSASSRGT